MKTKSIFLSLLAVSLFSFQVSAQILDQLNWGTSSDKVSSNGGVLGQTFIPSVSGELMEVEMILSAPKCYFDPNMTNMENRQSSSVPSRRVTQLAAQRQRNTDE